MPGRVAGAHEGETDNRQIVAEAVALRGEYARLMGFKSFAEFSLQDTMAKTPAAVDELLRAVWEKAVVRAAKNAMRLLPRLRIQATTPRSCRGTGGTTRRRCAKRNTTSTKRSSSRISNSIT